MQVRLWDICVHDWARGELGFPPLAGEVGNGLDASVVQSCLFLWPHELWPTRLLCPWGLPGKNIGVGCRALLQGIFLTQGSNLSRLHLLQWQEDFYHWATWEALGVVGYGSTHFTDEVNGARKIDQGFWKPHSWWVAELTCAGHQLNEIRFVLGLPFVFLFFFIFYFFLILFYF